MKMRFIAMAAITASVAFVACKKNSRSEDTDETTVSAQLVQHTDDQSRVSNDMDAVDNDINAALEDPASPFGRVENAQNIMQAPCDATVTFDSTVTDRRMIITFTGALCDSFRTRTGQITVSIPRTQRWRDSGATLTETITNLKITRRSDNKSITINGNRTVKNVTGGRLITLQPGAVLKHSINGSMTITFDDNTQRVWNVARMRSFTRAGNFFNISIVGTHTDGATTGIAEWGTARNGASFATQIVDPLMIKGECHYRLGAGKIVHTRMAHNVTVTYGLNAQGTAQTTCPGMAPYYLKAEWTGANGQAHSELRPYF